MKMHGDVTPLLRQWLGELRGFLINEQGDIVFCQKTGITFSLCLTADHHFIQIQYLVSALPTRGDRDFLYQALVLNIHQPQASTAFLGVDPLKDRLVLTTLIPTHTIYRASIATQFEAFARKAFNLKSQLQKETLSQAM